MTEMINHATVHKDSSRDTLCQDAFVYDQADFAAACLQENQQQYAVFQVHFLAQQSADNTFPREGLEII